MVRRFRLGWMVLLGMVLPCATVLRAAAPARPVLVLGDSLSAAYNIPRSAGWVHQLGLRLDTVRAGSRVINASVAGATTADGIARLPGLLARERPALVLLELGANDGLRGLPLAEIEGNLARMIRMCRDAHAKVLLLGIELPVNYGPQYRDGLRQVYARLARRFDVPLVPFLLARVALRPDLMQDDGLHPRAAGEPLVLDTVWPAVARALGLGAAAPSRAPHRGPG